MKKTGIALDPLPDEVTSIILSLLSIEDLIRFRRISNDFKKVSDKIVSDKCNLLFYKPSTVFNENFKNIKYHYFLKSIDQLTKGKILRNLTVFILMQLPKVFEKFIEDCEFVFGNPYFGGVPNEVLMWHLKSKEVSFLNEEIRSSNFVNKDILKIIENEYVELPYSVCDLWIDIEKIGYHYLKLLSLQAAYYLLDSKQQALLIYNYFKNCSNSVCHVEFKNNDSSIGNVKYEDIELTFKNVTYYRSDTYINFLSDSFQITIPYYIGLGGGNGPSNKFHVDRLSFEALTLDKIVSYKPNEELLEKKMNAELKKISKLETESKQKPTIMDTFLKFKLK